MRPTTPEVRYPHVRHARKIAMAALVAIFVVALLPAGAGAKTHKKKKVPKLTKAPREFYGIASLDLPPPVGSGQLGRADAGTYRLIMSWNNVEPTPGARDWAALRRRCRRRRAQRDAGDADALRVSHHSPPGR